MGVSKQFLFLIVVGFDFLFLWVGVVLIVLCDVVGGYYDHWRFENVLPKILVLFVNLFVLHIHFFGYLLRLVRSKIRNTGSVSIR